MLVTTGRYIDGTVGRHHQHHAALQERRDGPVVLLGRDRDDPELHPVRHQGLAEFSKPNLARFRFVPVSTVAPTGPVTAPPDEIIESAGFDMLNAELVEFGRCIAEKRPYPVAIDQVLHGMAVFDAVVRSGKSGQIERVD